MSSCRTLALLVILGACERTGASHEPQPVSLIERAQAGPALFDTWSELASRRQTQISRLRTYSQQGEFPHNHAHPTFTPQFVDERDVACAVGHLMRLDGRTDDVLAIARANNAVLVEAVDAGPLIDWLATSGLTKSEAALIQPAYRPRPRPRPPEEPPPPPIILVEPEQPKKTRPKFDPPPERPSPDIDELERKRLRAHFAKVEAQLIADTNHSLASILRSMLPTLAPRFGARAVDFSVGAPEQVRSIANPGQHEVAFQLVAVNGAGQVLSTQPWQLLEAGQSAELNVPGGAWTFVEWQGLSPARLVLRP